MPLVHHPLVARVIGFAIEVHKALGPGLLESTYRRCLCWELSGNGVAFETEVAVPVEYRGMRLDCGYRIDMLVEGWLVVETKSVASILPIHMAQVMTYVRLARCRQGLIINFNAPRLKDGLRSVLPRVPRVEEAGVVDSHEAWWDQSDMS
jgi:GxxExxY protein